MSIQYKFFMIPVKNNQDSETELNEFLKRVRVVSIHREFVSQGNESFFSIILEYMDKQAASNTSDYSKSKPRIDYREVLSPENFAIFDARSQALPGNVFLAALPPVQFVGGRATSENVPRQSLGTSTRACLRLA